MHMGHVAGGGGVTAHIFHKAAQKDEALFRYAGLGFMWVYVGPCSGVEQLWAVLVVALGEGVGVSRGAGIVPL
jgi:hypothetical protein